MSDLLIRGMNMPESCPCELPGIGYDVICSFVGGVPVREKEYYECCQNGTRPSWCPLVPVPPHGDLIDRDAERLNDEIFKLRAFKSRFDIKEMLDAAPVVVPAEEGE